MARFREETETWSQGQSQLAELSSSAKSSLSVVSPPPVDEYRILSQVLGQRSRWQKCLRSMSRQKVIGGLRVASSNSPSTI
ncbi:hypothetical protein TorRG33x02_291890 [Trema orientale]|uniref:Uncharacterized protein n=1 Tax=Trema orientale TaxID=63057 RepID=A0A2P5CAU3_TREOI|nr:hypothetical protein TorRG33x02_291890 [Trema orientale]